MNKRILRSLLIHIFIVWVVININHVLPYVYRVHTFGNYLWKEDGTATTTFEYFLLVNHYPLFCKIFLFIPLVEFIYWYLFKRGLTSKAIIASIFAGIFTAILVHLPWQYDDFMNRPFSVIEASIVFAGYAMVCGFVRKSLHERRVAKEMKLHSAENELNALKSQLNPHFFFNCLNYLYGQALGEKAAQTAETVNKISEMMRYTIIGMQKTFVPLTEELKFVRNYVSLQCSRLPQKDSISIKIQIADYESGHQIAPLILLPFIENAFKYGTSVDYPCLIDLEINVSDSRLTMGLKNRIIIEHDEIAGNNTGISNARKRLELLYENNHSLECGERGEIYNVVLAINLNNN